MGRAASAGRLAAAAAVGGGGLGLLGGSLYGVLRLEAVWARRAIGDAVLAPPDPSGLYGAMQPGPPVRLAVLGDSAAAGYGATVPQETFGAYLATGLSMLAHRPVRLRSLATVGAQTTDLMGQIEHVLPHNPDVVAIVIGANDVTHRIRPRVSLAALRQAVDTLRHGKPPAGALRAGGPQVVVGTCPDLGTSRPLAPPLRQVARRWSRRLAAAQTIAVVESGGHSVSLGSLLGPDFEASPLQMFGPDRFHPSPAGYRSVATAMLPTVANVIGVLPEDGQEPEAYRGGVFALARAAASAAEHSGTEVSELGRTASSRPGGRVRALLVRRRKHPIPPVGPIAPGQPDLLAGAPT
jgi:lysophospholipase L1-like esterase